MKKNFELVIQERLRLPTNQRILEHEFGILPKNAVTKETIQTWSSWQEDKQNRYIVLIGGPVNKPRTREYFNKILKGQNAT